MSLITASALGVLLMPGMIGGKDHTPLDESKRLVTVWAKVISSWKPDRNAAPVNTESWALDETFEKVNGGAEGSLVMLATLLEGKEVSIRRSAATVIGAIRIGVDNQVGGWQKFRSKELSLASKYVLDSDDQTAKNASDAFVNLLAGERWDGWGPLQSEWVRALSTSNHTHAANLAKMFAFTSIPVNGAVPGLHRLVTSSDPIVSTNALYALCRAQVIDPAELSSIVFVDRQSKKDSDREKAFKTLEALSGPLWDGASAFHFVQAQVDSNRYLTDAWMRCTAKSGNDDLSAFWTKNQKELLGTLEAGIHDAQPEVRLSSTNALISIGKQVDLELGWGTIQRTRTQKDEVARLLNEAAVSLKPRNPLLSDKARALATGFDRPRTIG